MKWIGIIVGAVLMLWVVVGTVVIYGEALRRSRRRPEDEYEDYRRF